MMERGAETTASDSSGAHTVLPATMALILGESGGWHACALVNWLAPPPASCATVARPLHSRRRRYSGDGAREMMGYARQ